jgi:hypothetical protein
MTEIKITEFAGYEKPAFLAYLNLYKTDFINLILPKDHAQHQGLEYLLDYYKLLYVMQTLHPYVDTLILSEPNPPEQEIFSIIILYKPSQPFYEALWYIKQGYDKTDTDRYAAFESRALDTDTYIMDSAPEPGRRVLEFIKNYPLDKE